ncbi:MAG: glycoside hydrolase family 3 N-terminal domain-containing protein [Pseudanabaenaceae cyanobacterium]
MGQPPWHDWPLARQVAQLVVIRASGHSYDRQIAYPQWEPPTAQLRYLVQEVGVGGVLLLGGSALEIHARTQQLQSWAEVPLLMAADVEEGVGQRFAGGVWWPPPMALAEVAAHDLPTACRFAQHMGECTAREALALGVNWLLAPVADVNNNPHNPVIDVRAFGDRPAVVAPLVAHFVRGARAHPVLTTAKHFPGHGDTATDSHLALPVLPFPPARFAAMEFPPFQAAIAAGADAVMTAHVLAPQWDTAIATASSVLVTEVLRQQLGFTGLVVTDALVMAGATAHSTETDLAVAALRAGVDVLLMPANPVATIQAVVAAIEAGTLRYEQLTAALNRLWAAKARVAIGGQDFPVLGEPADWQAVETLLTQSNRHFIPPDWQRPDTGVNLVVVEAAPLLAGRSPAVSLPVAQGWPPLLVNREGLAHLNLETLPPVFLQVFGRGNPFRGDRAPYREILQTTVQTLVHHQKLAALMVYGSPQVLTPLLPLLPDTCPWGFSYGQHPTAQAIALAPFWDQATTPVSAFTD